MGKKIDETVIGFSVFENGNEYIGTAEATLPEIANVTEEISGAGIGGKYESTILGAIEAMSMTLNFRTVNPNAISLNEPRKHNLSLRAVHQVRDNETREIEYTKVRHEVTITPKKLSMGKLTAGGTGDVSGEYSVSALKTYIDNKLMLEIDPFNYIYTVNGTDYLKEVRNALGK